MKRICIVIACLVIFPIVFFTSVYAHTDLKRDFYLRELKGKKLSDMNIVPLCDTLINYARLDYDTLSVCRFLLRKGNCLKDNGYFQKAIRAYNEIIQINRETTVSSDSLLFFQNEACLSYIKSLQNLELYDLSIEKCYELLENQNSDDYLLFAHSFLALRYTEKSDTLRASTHLHIADSIAGVGKFVKPEILGEYYNHKAGVLFFESKYEQALECLETGMEYLGDVHDYSYNSIAVNMAAVYWRLGEYDLAKRCYRRGLSFFKDSDPVLYLRMTYYYAGLCYDIQEVDSAFYYCRQVINMSDSIQDNSELYGDCRVLYSHLLYQRGRYKESRDYYVLGQKYLESLNKMRSKEQLAILLDNVADKKEVLLHDDWKNRVSGGAFQICAVMLLVLFLLAVVLFYLFLSAKREKQQCKLLFSQELDRKQKEIVDLRRLNQSRLMSHSGTPEDLGKSLMVYHEVYLQIEKKVDALSHTSDLKQIEDRVADLQNAMKDAKEKEIISSLEEYFKDKYVNYFTNLQEKGIPLNNKELQLCILLVIELPAKDIAFYMNKSVRTIETMIYKLRRKFEIPSNMKTPDYFKQFMEGC